MKLQGQGVSPGVVVGPALVWQSATLVVPFRALAQEQVEAELDRLHQALETTRADLRALADTLRRVVTELKGVMRVVTGHAEGLADARDPSSTSVDISTPRMMRWSDVEEYADFTRDFVDAVRKARAAGKTAAAAAAGLSLPDRYRDYDMRNAPAAVESIYKESAR